MFNWFKKKPEPEFNLAEFLRNLKQLNEEITAVFDEIAAVLDETSCDLIGGTEKSAPPVEPTDDELYDLIFDHYRSAIEFGCDTEEEGNIVIRNHIVRLAGELRREIERLESRNRELEDKIKDLEFYRDRYLEE